MHSWGHSWDFWEILRAFGNRELLNSWEPLDVPGNLWERWPPRGVFIAGAPKEVLMRKITIGLLALAGVALSMPAQAQGVWIGAGPVGVGVGVGPGYGYYDRGYYGPGYRSYAYDNGYTYRRHCRVIRDDFNGRMIR